MGCWLAKSQELHNVVILILYFFHVLNRSTFVKPIAEFVDKLEFGNAVYNGVVCNEMDEFPFTTLLSLF
jgi:hypothetical protein